MSKWIWKWIIESKPDDKLVEMSNLLKIKVPGFRQINTNQNMKLLRPKLINALIQTNNLKLLESFYDEYYKDCYEDDEYDDYRTKTEAELLELTKREYIKPSDVLASLLSSEDKSHKEIAESIYKILTEEKVIDELEENIEQKDEDETKQLNLLDLQENKTVLTGDGSGEIKQLKKKLKKSEEKNQQLQEKLSQLEKELQEQKRSWKEEKKDITQKLAVQTQEFNRVRNLLDKKDQEVEELKKTLQEKDEIILNYKAEISNLNAICMNLGHKKEKANEPTKKTELEEPKPVLNKKIIYLIGNPKNSKVLKLLSDYNIPVIEPEEISEVIEGDTLANGDQVWMLTYKVPKNKQLQIKNNVAEEKLLEFETFINLQKHIQKGL